MPPVKPVVAMESWIASGKISKATIFSWSKQMREGVKIQAKNTEALKAFTNFHEAWQKELKQAVVDGMGEVVEKAEVCKTEIMGQAEANKNLILEKLDKLQMAQQAPASSSAYAPQITAAAPQIAAAAPVIAAAASEIGSMKEGPVDSESEDSESEDSESELDLSKLSKEQHVELEDEENRVSDEVGADHTRKREEPLNEYNRKTQEADNECNFEIQEADMEHKRKVQEANNKRKRKAQEAMDECELKERR